MTQTPEGWIQQFDAASPLAKCCHNGGPANQKTHALSAPMTDRVSLHWVAGLRLMVAGGRDGSLEFWHTDPLHLAARVESAAPDAAPVLSIRHLKNGHLRMLDAAGGISDLTMAGGRPSGQKSTPVATMASDLRSGCLSPCGRYCLALDWSDRFWFRAIGGSNTSPVLVFEGYIDLHGSHPIQGAAPMAFSPSGEHFVFCDSKSLCVGQSIAPCSLTKRSARAQAVWNFATFDGDAHILAGEFRSGHGPGAPRNGRMLWINFEDLTATDQIETLGNPSWPHALPIAAHICGSGKIAFLTGLGGPLWTTREWTALDEIKELPDDMSRRRFMACDDAGRVYIPSQSGIEIYAPQVPQRKPKPQDLRLPDRKMRLVGIGAQSIDIGLLPMGPDSPFPDRADILSIPTDLPDISQVQAHKMLDPLVRLLSGHEDPLTLPQRDLAFQRTEHGFQAYHLASGQKCTKSPPIPGGSIMVHCATAAPRMFGIVDEQVMELSTQDGSVLRHGACPFRPSWRSGAVSNCGNALLISNRTHWAVLDCNDHFRVKQLQAHVADANHFSWIIDPDLKTVTISSAFDILCTYSIETGRVVHAQRVPTQSILTLHTADNLVTGWCDGVVSCWPRDMASAEMRQTSAMIAPQATQANLTDTDDFSVLAIDRAIQIISKDRPELSKSVALDFEGLLTINGSAVPIIYKG